jgi:hypothetical protein
MYIKEVLKKYEDKKIKLFIDMDGVIADYDFGTPKEYDKKRPLYDSIKKLEDISKMNNIELHILSVTRMTNGREEKNIWLDKYVPFIKKENRIIISREENDFMESSKLKAQYLGNTKTDDLIIVIDDDPQVLKKINETNKNIVLLKDTVLVD